MKTQADDSKRLRKRTGLIAVIVPLVLLVLYPLVTDWQERRRHDELAAMLTTATRPDDALTEPSPFITPNTTSNTQATVTTAAKTSATDTQPTISETTAEAEPSSAATEPVARIPTSADFQHLLALNPDTVA